jgi:hypothetical protein
VHNPNRFVALMDQWQQLRLPAEVNEECLAVQNSWHQFRDRGEVEYSQFTHRGRVSHKENTWFMMMRIKVGVNYVEDEARSSTGDSLTQSTVYPISPEDASRMSCACCLHNIFPCFSALSGLSGPPLVPPGAQVLSSWEQQCP